MSASDDRKAKRRRQKKGPVAKTSAQNESTCQNIHETFGLANPSEDAILSPGLDSETMKKLEKLMDAKNDADIPHDLLSLSRGPNPFLDKERCLLCGCERIDPPEAAAIRAKSPEKKNPDTNALAQLPLWVCPDCRKSTEQGMDNKVNISSFMEEPDLPPEPSSLPFVDPALDSEPVSPNGTVCNCEACTERRQIEAEHDKETQELQNCWTELRKLVRMLYGRRDGEVMEKDESIPDEDKAKELVHRLCARDPHQLFLRLESQVREFVIEMKVKLLKQLNSGYKTPPEAKSFIQLLLDEYSHLCVVSRQMAEILTKLKNDHLAKFHLTWELHNKHLFQSIAYTELSIQSSLHLIISQLRLGAASKESYNEDTYPNLLHRYLKFDDEMSVISVVWRDSYQKIEQYNEEQSALKLKQKMLKEDWEFFKAQRKILEDHVAKNSKSPVSHSSFEAQFTETMRLMLQGSKPGPEECHCSRCNRKRCPCDECTITHMITCGIINPEALEASNPNHPSFLHDPNRYRIDVSPPSMSSTTSSSGSSSPILVEREPRIRSFDLDENLNDGGEEEEIQEEIENNSQSYEGDEADDDMEDEDEDDEDEDDDYDLDDDEDEEEEEDETEGDGDDEEELNVDTKKEDLTAELTEMSSKSWMNDPDDDGAVELISEKCDCYHCVSQAQAEQMIKLNENSCQCYVCLRQKGQTISTSLPQQVTTETSRPGELHLYPHIHGSAGLHGLANQHVRPLLPTQLYDLHMPPVRQPKPLLQTSTKVPLKLDFDSPEGIHEHIYHAYGEWDNTYDPRMLLPKYGTLGTDLLPPPPLTTNFSTTSFLTEPFSVGTQTFGDTLPSSTSATSAFKTSVNNQVSSTTKGSESAFVHNHDHTAPKVSRTESSSKNMTPPCTRPIPVGGNISQQKGGSVAGCGGDKLHSQHCRHHNSSLLNKNNNNFQAHNHTSNSSNLPVKVTQDFIQTAARNIRENAKEGMQMIRQFASSLNANVNNSHSCNHSLPNSQGHSHQASATGDQNHTGNCPNAVTMATTVNNVSVGTSTVCMDQDCEGHFEDNCDSVDDSCSEQSSSTSTSNQKEGKYCDCCYCEFFGHGNPPVAPTSKNYAEMRDRLRLRLKKKNEARQEDGVTHSENCIARNNHSKNQRQLESQGLDELIKYINGTDQKDSQNFEKSSKAAKRARQKQRKAEEKARLEAEKLQEELERKEREKEKNLANTAKLENLKNNQKKKKRKEKMKSDENVQETKDARIVREPPLGKEDDTREKRSKSRNSSKKDVVTQSEDKEIHARISCGNTQKISVMSSASASVVNTQQTLDQRMNCHLTPAKSKSCVTSTVNSAPKENGNIVSEKCRIIEGSAKNADRNDTKSSNNSHSKSRTNEESEQMQRKGKNVSKLSNSYNKSKTNEESEQVQKKGKRLNEASPCIKNHVIEPSLKSQSPKPEQSTNKPQQVQKQLSQLRQNDLQSKNGTHQQISKQTLPQNAVKQQPQNNKQQVNNSFKQTSPSVKQQVVQQPGKAQPAKQPQGNLSKSQNTQSPQPQTKGNSNQYSNSKVQQLQPTTPQGKVQSPQVTPKTDPHQHTKNVQQGSKASTNLHTQNKLSFQQFLQSPANCSKQSMSFTPAPQQSPRQVQQSPKSTQQRSAVIQNGSHTLKPQEKTSVVKGGVLGPVVENGVNSGLKHSSGTSSVSTPQQSRTSPDGHRTDKNKNKQEDSPPSNDQKGTRSKKNKKKNRNSEDLTTVIDEIFLPKDISEAEHGDMDDVEKELEEFKRFCLDSTPVKREKLQVNMNLKDIFVKKKSGLGCS